MDSSPLRCIQGMFCSFARRYFQDLFGSISYSMDFFDGKHNVVVSVYSIFVFITLSKYLV